MAANSSSAAASPPASSASLLHHCTRHCLFRRPEVSAAMGRNIDFVNHPVQEAEQV